MVVAVSGVCWSWFENPVLSAAPTVILVMFGSCRRTAIGGEVRTNRDYLDRAQSILSSFPESAQKSATLVTVRRGSDRHERAYHAIGTLMTTLAGASAVIAALSVQLLTHRSPDATVVGFAAASTSFAIAGGASILGIFRTDGLAIPNLPLPETEDIPTLDSYIIMEESRRKLLKRIRNNRLVVAVFVVAAMLVSLLALAVGQTT